MSEKMTKDQTIRRLRTLVDSYASLVEQEKIARTNGNEKHLSACLAGQTKVLAALGELMPPQS